MTNDSDSTDIITLRLKAVRRAAQVVERIATTAPSRPAFVHQLNKTIEIAHWIVEGDSTSEVVDFQDNPILSGAMSRELVTQLTRN